MDDQRKEPRFALVLRADFADRSQALDATENLSAGGVFVRTERAFSVGETVSLQLSFPGLLEPVEISGEIAWTRPEGPHGPPGVGVRVPEERTADRARLREIIGTITTPRTDDPNRGFRVLIVEDNPHIIEMYAYVLKKLSRTDMGSRGPLEVKFAADGHLALAELRRLKFDLVMTDLYMPVLDGFALVQRIRDDEILKTTPVMVISAGGPEAQQKAIELGVDVYLRKPVRFVEVLETVKGLLRIG